MKKALLVGFAVLLSVMVFCPAVFAQTKPSETVDLDLTMAPIDSALKILFSGKGLNYTLDSNVQGIVKEVHLKGVPFDTALKTLLKQVDPPLVYRKEGDVYLISVKKDVPKVDTVTTTIDTSAGGTSTVESLKGEDMKLEKITLRFLDAYELKAMIEGGTDTSRGYGGTGWGSGNTGFGGGWTFGFDRVADWAVVKPVIVAAYGVYWVVELAILGIAGWLAAAGSRALGDGYALILQRSRLRTALALAMLGLAAAIAVLSITVVWA